jgi:hypothetical protein
MVPRKFIPPLFPTTYSLLTWTQIWEYFLAYSTIISRQGSASCYQIVLHKNINSFHRVEGIPTQYGLKGATAATKADLKAWAEANAVDFPSVPAQ